MLRGTNVLFSPTLLIGIDQSPVVGSHPPFHQQFTLWEVAFNRSIDDVVDLNIPGAVSYFRIFPSLTLNPSQDYSHLKQRRAEMESQGYLGLVVRSSRATTPGNLVVLFEDQSSNVRTITPHMVEFRLVDEGGRPFHNHATQILDFRAGEVRFVSGAPAHATRYTSWQRVEFNH